MREGRTVHLLGVPTALGGHAGGMERSPAGLRELGLVDRLAEALPGSAIRDHGDLEIDPGFRPDPDPRMKNHDLIVAMLPRVTSAVEEALARTGGSPASPAPASPAPASPAPATADQATADEEPADDSGAVRTDGLLLLLGGDCTAHAGALPGVRRALGGASLGIAWFDAHGDFNTPETTPSGNVWGMPFALICGRGDPALVRAAGGPSVDEGHAALLGGQVLDEQESRVLAASRVAQFGAGMLGTPAGMAALRAWAEVVSRDVAGWYVAVDMDCLDASGEWAVQMPERAGLALETVLGAVATIGAAGPVVAIGATGINLANGDPSRTLDAVVALAGGASGDDAALTVAT